MSNARVICHWEKTKFPHDCKLEIAVNLPEPVANWTRFDFQIGTKGTTLRAKCEVAPAGRIGSFILHNISQQRAGQTFIITRKDDGKVIHQGALPAARKNS